MTIWKLSYDIIIENIIYDIPFAFTRWWDFEWATIMQNWLQSCDGNHDIKELWEALSSIIDSKPEYYLWLQWLAMSIYWEYIKTRIDPTERSDADIVHVRNIDNGLYDLLDILEDKDTMLIWPEYLRKLEVYKTYIQTPDIDTWYHIDEVFKNICDVLDKKDFMVVCFIVWATTKVLIDMIYNKYWNKFILLDIGSAFDPYVWKISRDYHKTLDIKNRKILSVIVPVYNELAYTKCCIENLRKVCNMESTEIIVVNDFSLDWTTERLEEQKDIIVVNQYENKWVTFSRNHWVAYAKWKYICVINNDTEFPELFFEKLMAGFDNKKILMTCPRFTQKREDYWDRIFYFDKHIAWFCFMIKTIWKKILFPIDERLKIFGNDNWLYQKLTHLWYGLKLVKDAIMHHYKSRTVWKIENTDLKVYREICIENWRSIVDVYTPEDTPETDLIFTK